MNRTFQTAAAEKGLGFFLVAPRDLSLTWADETKLMLGERAEGDRIRLSEAMRSGLRAYVARALAGGSQERLHLLAPLAGEVAEVVILPGEKGPKGPRPGFFAPYPLHESVGLLKKYFLSNTANKLRSLLNSVIIASDVVAASPGEALSRHQKFLSLMAEDAREVNTLLNRLGETVNLSALVSLDGDDAVDTAELLNSVYANLHYLAEDASIALGLALPDSLPSLKGGRALLTLTFFLAVHHALTRTEPLGEIIVTAREGKEGWALEVWFSDKELPGDLAVANGKSDLVPRESSGWSESSGLQLIDSLLGLMGSGLKVLGGSQGDNVLVLALPGD